MTYLMHEYKFSDFKKLEATNHQKMKCESDENSKPNVSNTFPCKDIRQFSKQFLLFNLFSLFI